MDRMSSGDVNRGFLKFFRKNVDKNLFFGKICEKEFFVRCSPIRVLFMSEWFCDVYAVRNFFPVPALLQRHEQGVYP